MHQAVPFRYMSYRTVTIHTYTEIHLSVITDHIRQLAEIKWAQGHTTSITVVELVQFLS